MILKLKPMHSGGRTEQPSVSQFVPLLNVSHKESPLASEVSISSEKVGGFSDSLSEATETRWGARGWISGHKHVLLQVELLHTAVSKLNPRVHRTSTSKPASKVSRWAWRIILRE